MCLTWSPVSLLHPDVAVALGNAGLGVQEGETHGSLSTQTSIVAAAVFNGLFVELLSETEAREAGGEREVERGEDEDRGGKGRKVTYVQKVKDREEK